jgi:hypothetical protein
LVFVRKLEENTNDQPKGIFYFAHTVSLQFLLMALEINTDDKPLKATDDYSPEKRNYRSSFQASFSANLIAVFFKLITTIFNLSSTFMFICVKIIIHLNSLNKIIFM